MKAQLNDIVFVYANVFTGRPLGGLGRVEGVTVDPVDTRYRVRMLSGETVLLFGEEFEPTILSDEEEYDEEV